jgi:hypothetical protein
MCQRVTQILDQILDLPASGISDRNRSFPQEWIAELEN